MLVCFPWGSPNLLKRGLFIGVRRVGTMNDAAACWGAWYAAYRAGRADRLSEPQVCEICSAGKPLGTQKLGVEMDRVKFMAQTEHALEQIAR